MVKVSAQLELASDEFKQYSASYYTFQVKSQFPEIFNGRGIGYFPMEVKSGGMIAIQPIFSSSTDPSRAVFTYALVRQTNGWKVDNIELGNCYIPGPCGNPFEVGNIPPSGPQTILLRSR